MNQQFCEQIHLAFEDYDDDLLTQTLNAAMDQGEDPVEIMSLLSKALEEIGEKFSQGELFLPDMVLAGDMMSTAMELLKPALVSSSSYQPTGHKILFGSVKGDVHDIGKNMVKMMWMGAGIEVIDLGVDVSAETFLERAEEAHPAIVALSSTMTTTIPSMRDTIELLDSRGINQKCKILVGGGSMTAETAKSMGACYGGRDAFAALKIVQALLA